VQQIYLNIIFIYLFIFFFGQTHLGHSTVGFLYSKPSSSITNGVTFVKLPLVKFECSLWMGAVVDVVAAGTVELEPVVVLAAVVVTGGAPIV